jgi:RimJ/RimL family protein N-acetyltransferase
MNEPLKIYTENPDVILRELKTEADDIAYFEAVDADRDHLNQYGDTTSRKYPTLQDVTKARVNAGGKLRMGIWDPSETFLGSINARANDDAAEVEIGYWLRSKMQGHGYATVAVKALTNYLRPSYHRVFAEVHEGNEGSMKVLRRAGYSQTGKVERDWGPAVVFEAK